MSVELGEIEPDSRVQEREGAGGDNYPEEWPKEFVSHGGQVGDSFMSSHHEVDIVAFNRDGSGDRSG